MFEKEAEEYLKKDGTKAESILNMLNEISPLKITLKQVPFVLAMIQQVFKDGAEFGYNKAKEELEEEAKAIAKENAELKEKLDKIRKYLVYDILDRFKYFENLLKISQETQEELSKRIFEQQKTIGSAITNQIEKILNKFK